MSIFRSHIRTALTLLVSMCAVVLFVLPAVAEATSATTGPQTVDLVMTKHISGVTQGFLLSDFSYHITGGGVDAVVPHGSFISLGLGTYSIEELVPAGFFKSDWRIGWYGECEAGSAYTTTVTIDDGNVDHGTLDCQADNQYRPDNGDNPEYGCTDPTANNYDAAATIDDGSCAYDPDPIPGCTDAAANNYNPAATEDDGSCTYDETYLIEGYVWHDENENGVIDDGEDFLENWSLTLTNGSTTLTTASNGGGYYSFEVPEGEWKLFETVEDGWSQVFPTPTTYMIDVPTDITSCNITRVGFPLNLFVTVAHAAQQTSCVQYNFGNLFTGGGNNGGNGDDDLACSISATDTTIDQGDTVTLSWSTTGATDAAIDNNIGTTSLAGSTDVTPDSDTTYTLTASTATSSVTCTVSIDVSQPGGSSGGGGGKKISLSSGGGGSSSDDDAPATPEPTPQVLGDQVSFVPFGAPNAGAGGTAPTNTVAMVTALLLIGFTVRRVFAH